MQKIDNNCSQNRSKNDAEKSKRGKYSPKRNVFMLTIRKKSYICEQNPIVALCAIRAYFHGTTLTEPEKRKPPQRFEQVRQCPKRSKTKQRLKSSWETATKIMFNLMVIL